jgi:hypothetical protein
MSAVRDWPKAIGLPQYADTVEHTDTGMDFSPRINEQVLKGVSSSGQQLPHPARVGRRDPRAAGRAKTKRQFYWAYGSNLNLAHMAHRRPAAVPLAAVAVGGVVLRFRRVADVEPLAGAVCPGGLRLITDECAEALDQYEGVGSGLYERRFLGVEYNSEVRRCLYYRMLAGASRRPPKATSERSPRATGTSVSICRTCSGRWSTRGSAGTRPRTFVAGKNDANSAGSAFQLSDNAPAPAEYALRALPPYSIVASVDARGARTSINCKNELRRIDPKRNSP